MPKRIQLSRRKGWRKPEGAVVVARPSKWGNPFRVGDKLLMPFEGGAIFQMPIENRAHAVALFRAWQSRPNRWSPYIGINAPPSIAALAGKDLACWCPLDEPCHADVLLELVNLANGGDRGER